MKSIPIIFSLILAINFSSHSQTYVVSIDTTNVSTSTFEPHVIIDDSPDDSLHYEIKLFSYENQDTNLIYLDTFYFHNPKVLSFGKINFRYQTDHTFLTLKELNIAPFLVHVNVFTKEGILEEELILDSYE